MGNPEPNARPLGYAKLKVENGTHWFPPGTDTRLLCQRDATRTSRSASLAGATHAHFACHAGFDPDNPLASRLVPSGGESLAMPELLEQPDLFQRLKLAEFSARASVVPEFRRVPEEFIGFPGALLEAGIPAVIGV